MTAPTAGEPPLPLLGLALTRRPPHESLPLLVALHEWCLPATLDPAAGKPAAVLATTEGLHLAPSGVRLALWAQAEDTASDAFRSADLVLSDDPAVVAMLGPRGLLAPTGRHIGHRRPMSPFVRARLRLERGLHPESLAVEREDGWYFGPADALAPIDHDVIETALGAAAAAAVTDPGWLLRAFAWGTPTVTTAATAALVGAGPGDVLIGESADTRTAAAADLAGDEAQASRLSWRGYRRVEQLDAERAALVFVDRLSLWPEVPPRPAPPTPTLELALRLLGTPQDAHVRTRLAEATDTLSPAR